MSKYSALKQKYGSFSVPSYKITCDGTELKLSEYSIVEIVADNSVGETAGAARFTLTHVYERGSRKINGAALKMLMPGSKVSISLGYGSEVTEVFTGYIDELKTRFDENDIALTAMCLDARALMRDGSEFSASKDKKLKDVVTAVLDKYSSLISGKDVKLDSFEEGINITQTGSDLDYLVNAAKSRGALFYIDCGKAVIGSAQKTVCLEFDWEQFGLDLTIRYLNEKLTGYGNDITKMEPFSVQADAKQTAKQADLITVSNAKRIPHYFNKDTAQSHLDAVVARRVSESLYGTLYCVGLPEAKLGQKIKINKFPLADAGVGTELTVVSVGHRLNDETGYTTQIGVEG